MAWKPVVVGVDAGAESRSAAALAWGLAQAAHVECYLVHAVREYWIPFADDEVGQQTAEMQMAVLEAERHRLLEALKGHLPDQLVENAIVRFGRAPSVLGDVAREAGAGLVVLGGKHHTTLARWTGGSSAHNIVRTLPLPLLVVASPADRMYRRILVAVDLSPAAEPTVEAALEWADFLHADVRAVAVLEPPSRVFETVQRLPEPAYYARCEDALARNVWPLFGDRDVETLVRYGHPVEVLADEVAHWQADLIVVGSHGKHWGQRVVLGSVTERLLGSLPCSVLVVPVGLREREVTRLAREAQREERARRRHDIPTPTHS